MLTIATLSNEHARIEAVVAELLDITTRSRAPVAGISALRWRLNHLLAIHLAKEDKHLYPQLKASPIAEIAVMAARFEAEMGGLAEGFAAYGRKWDAQAMHADWEGFCKDTRQILLTLRWRIEREERDLYPRLLKAAEAPVARQASSAA
jgi:hypothetical protein